jgi:trimeric autotransporter adhesin
MNLTTSFPQPNPNSPAPKSELHEPKNRPRPSAVRTLAAVCLLHSACCLPLLADDPAFTYQGRLDDNGAPADGLYDFRFTIYNGPDFSGPTFALSSTSVDAVSVSNGLFTARLNGPAWVFNGHPRWLAIEVRTNGPSEYTLLNPWTELTPTPYAIRALTVTTNALDGDYPGAVTFSNPANSFAGSGAGLTGLNASQLTSGTVPDARLAGNIARTNQVWRLGGNAGTTPGTHFVGTSDNQPLEFRVNNLRALRLELNASGAPNVIGGSPFNSVNSGVVGATIGGGGATNYLDVAYTNRVLGDFGTVGGGLQNTASGLYTTVGGGYGNTASDNDATVGGGWDNTASSLGAAVGGGHGNTAGNLYATVGGGVNNTANGSYATIPGGNLNTAANHAFAAGRRAKANHEGAFVWADSTAADFASDRANQFKVRAGGGVHLVTGGSGLNPAGLRVAPTTANAVGLYVFQTSSDAAAVFENRGTGDQIKVFNGPGSEVFRVDNDGDVTAKSFNPTSDRNAKENFAPVCPQEMLAKVAALPITRWNFKGDEATPHVGPMAQDFHAAFGLGANDTTIATVDADGVALAAIQGLNTKVEVRSAKTESEIASLRVENLELKQRLAAVEQLLTKLGAKGE